MKIASFLDGHEIYDNVTSIFNFGEVHYIATPYICEKKDLNKVNTKYLAGKRFELIISSNEFNSQTPWRYTIPISTYHPQYDTAVYNSDILFKDKQGMVAVLRVRELRTRHVKDFYTDTGSYHAYNMPPEFLEIVLGKINDILPRVDSPEIKRYKESMMALMDVKPNNSISDNTADYLMTEINSLRERVSLLENRVEYSASYISPIPTSRAIDSTFESTTEFLNKFCDSTGDESDIIETSALYKKYAIFCEENGYKNSTPIIFTRRIQEILPEVTKKKKWVNGNSVQCFIGLSVKGEYKHIESSKNEFSKKIWDTKSMKEYLKDYKKLPFDKVVEKYHLTESSAKRYFHKFKKEVNGSTQNKWSDEKKYQFVGDSGILTDAELAEKYNISKKSAGIYKVKFVQDLAQYSDTKKK